MVNTKYKNVVALSTGTKAEHKKESTVHTIPTSDFLHKVGDAKAPGRCQSGSLLFAPALVPPSALEWKQVHTMEVSYATFPPESDLSPSSFHMGKNAT